MEKIGPIFLFIWTLAMAYIAFGMKDRKLAQKIMLIIGWVSFILLIIGAAIAVTITLINGKQIPADIMIFLGVLLMPLLLFGVITLYGKLVKTKPIYCPDCGKVLEKCYFKDNEAYCRNCNTNLNKHRIFVSKYSKKALSGHQPTIELVVGMIIVTAIIMLIAWIYNLLK